MKTIILFAMMASVVCLSCTHKRQQTQPETAPDKELVIMESNDTVAGIQDSSVNKYPVNYDTPECYLWYVMDLPDEYKDKPVSMWTEHPIYGENVYLINVFVSNPTSTSLQYGRGWYIEQWNGKEWVMAKTKGDIAWFDDGFIKQKAPLLYCFSFPIDRYYHLPKGKYRINKSFYAKREEIKLYAEFEIK